MLRLPGPQGSGPFLLAAAALVHDEALWQGMAEEEEEEREEEREEEQQHEETQDDYEEVQDDYAEE